MLRLYAEPGIADALLHLQENYAIDVPFYLAVLHAVKTDHHIGEKAMLALYGEVRAWRERVIIPLRDVRKALKVHAWARQDETRAFRETIKCAELNAEEIEVMALASLIPQYFSHDSTDGKPDILEVSLALLNAFASPALTVLPKEAEFIAESMARTLHD